MGQFTIIGGLGFKKMMNGSALANKHGQRLKLYSGFFVQAINNLIMRKLISFSLFLTILLLALVARNISQAQTIVVKTVPIVLIKPACVQHGYRWNKRAHRQAVVNNYWVRPRYYRWAVRVKA